MSRLSQYRGVYVTRGGGWEARIRIDERSKYLGNFRSEMDAAIAYNYYAAHLFGELAKLNKIEGEWAHD